MKKIIISFFISLLAFTSYSQTFLAVNGKKYLMDTTRIPNFHQKVRAVQSPGGLNYVVQSSAPSDTSQLWLDNATGSKGVWPLKIRLVNVWDTLMWWDPVALILTKDKPDYNLITGQSNAIQRGAAGDLTPHPLVLFWNGTNWVVWAPTLNSIAFQMAKERARRTGRVQRNIIIAEPSKPIEDWLPGGEKDVQISAVVRAASVQYFNNIVTRQGERNADLGYREGQYDSLYRTVTTAWHDSSWFGKSGLIIAMGLNESYLGTGVFDFYQKLNNGGKGGVGIVGVSVLGVSLVNGIHQDGLQIDTTGRRAGEASLGFMRQNSLPSTGYNSMIDNSTLLLQPSSGVNPGYRASLNTDQGRRGMGVVLDIVTSNGGLVYNNTPNGTQDNDIYAMRWNQSGNIGYGAPNTEVTTNIAKTVWYPQSGGPGLHAQWRNSTGTNRLSIDTGANIVTALTLYNANSSAGTIRIKTSSSTDPESGRIRRTKVNAAAADNNLGFYDWFDGSNNIWVFGSNNTNGSTGTTGDIEVFRIDRAGTGVSIKAGANPNSALQTTSFATAYTATAANLTLTIAHNVVEVTSTGRTITLPTAVGITGRIYTVKLTVSGTGTVATTSSQTIDGSTTYPLSAQYKYVTIQSNGSTWNIIGNN